MPNNTLARILLCLLPVLGAASAPLFAGEVNLLWNSSTGATGYKVYFGSSAGSLGSSVDVGNVVQTPYDQMTDCTATFFAVSAYNSVGESALSDPPISTWPRPVISGTNDSEAQRGEQIDLIITGTNYETGATVEFSNPGITVNSVTRNSCGQVTANITIGSSAAFGPTDIRVVNTNGVTGVASGLFSVVGIPLPPVENLRRTDKKPAA